MRLLCNCKHPHQDKKFGPGVRNHAIVKVKIVNGEQVVTKDVDGEIVYQCQICEAIKPFDTEGVPPVPYDEGKLDTLPGETIILPTKGDDSMKLKDIPVEKLEQKSLF